MHKLIKYSACVLCLSVFLAPVMLPTTSQAMFSITIYFGNGRACEGFGFCKIVIGAAREAEAPKSGEAERASRNGQASATVEQDKSAREANHLYLKIEMNTPLPIKAAVMPVAEDLTLDAATSKALGHKSITVLKGNYKIDYSKNKFGSLAVNMKAGDKTD